MIWSLIGKAAALYVLAKLICFTCTFLRSYVFPMFGLGIDLKSYGKWAVITGATDGIGKSYCKQLAKNGLNIVLISRSEEKLDAVSKEIGEAYNVETQTIAFDFSAVDGYEKIENELKDMNIGILVNNVGIIDEIPELFGSSSDQFNQKLLNVNTLAVVKMSHIVLKGMLQRKKGILVHVSSEASHFPLPLFALYCSTKVFIDFFARALQIEYRNQGIISQALLPAMVATRMSKLEPSLFVPHSDSYATQALKTIGIVDKTRGYWTHELLALFGDLFPERLRNFLSLEAMKMLRDEIKMKYKKNIPKKVQ